MKTATPGGINTSFRPWSAFKGTKTKNATSCGNVFETNILLASCPPKSVRRNENQSLYTSTEFQSFYQYKKTLESIKMIQAF